jgi:DNA-binding transcriptional regulator LsrR (DeoR family)
MESSLSKNKEYREQMGRVFRCFYEHPKTMLDVSIETGILRANICRYVSHMEDDGRIQIHHKGIDKTTKCRAAYYTTNPELFNQPPVQQMALDFGF